MKAIRHCCGMTCLGWPPLTSTLTTRLWRGCLHEHPHTPQNHDLMPLIYTVSRAYQKVSSGALRQVYKGFAGTQLHWAWGIAIWILDHWYNCKWYKMLICAISFYLVLSATAASCFGKQSMFFCCCIVVSQGTRQERMMWSWVRLMCGKWNMCWDDSVDEEWCLYGRWRMTGWK